MNTREPTPRPPADSERDARINAVLEHALDLRRDERREVIATLLFFDRVMSAKVDGPS
jgi:hypothetical protein